MSMQQQQVVQVVIRGWDERLEMVIGWLLGLGEATGMAETKLINDSLLLICLVILLIIDGL